MKLLRNANLRLLALGLIAISLLLVQDELPVGAHVYQATPQATGPSKASILLSTPGILVPLTPAPLGSQADIASPSQMEAERHRLSVPTVTPPRYVQREGISDASGPLAWTESWPEDEPSPTSTPAPSTPSPVPTVIGPAWSATRSQQAALDAGPPSQPTAATALLVPLVNERPKGSVEVIARATFAAQQAQQPKEGE